MAEKSSLPTSLCNSRFCSGENNELVNSRLDVFGSEIKMKVPTYAASADIITALLISILKFRIVRVGFDERKFLLDS